MPDQPTPNLSQLGKRIYSHAAALIALARSAHNEPYLLLMGAQQWWLLQQYAEHHDNIIEQDAHKHELICGVRVLLWGQNLSPTLGQTPSLSLISGLHELQQQFQQQER